MKKILDIPIKEIKNALTQSEFKNIWKSMINDEIKQSDYRNETHKIINEIRNTYGVSSIADYEFDKTWQFLILGSGEFEVAFGHMTQAIYQQY